MSTATIARPTHFLDEAMLSRFRERAPGYDRENRFFHEDFEELRSAGYLKFAVPKHHGGSGRNLVDYQRELVRLASYAPATALATNMHMAWTGLAADLEGSGDHSFDWLSQEVGAGEVIARSCQ